MRRKRWVWMVIFIAAAAGIWGFIESQTQFRPHDLAERILFTSLGQPKSLDPAHASDYASCVAVLSLYDTLFEYDYTKRPYQVVPSMLACMPTVSDDGLTWDFTLRNDLFFAPDSCFVTDSERSVTSDDVIHTILRLADPTILSPGYWIVRGKIAGLDTFRTIVAQDRDAAYLKGCEGLVKIDELRFRIVLPKADPRLPYMFAMAYSAIVSRKADEFYGAKLAEHAVGSGPFVLSDYRRDYRLEMDRSPTYRKEFFTDAETVSDRTRPLPLMDRIICYLVQDPQPAWLMFLNGALDLSTVSKEQMDAVGAGGTLPPALSERGIRLLTAPELQINYIGLSFTDPRLANNLHLRRAISLAYDVGLRQRYYNGLIIPASGPIPPNVSGYDPDFRNPWLSHNLDSARTEMTLAGYPDGIDPKTGKRLVLTFDLPESGPQARQLAEMMVNDMAKIGIEIEPFLNSKPKFLEKNRVGETQLFRFNWICDYPDAENFLQLFYSPNAGASNRVYYRNPAYDRAYEKAVAMPDSPERDSAYRALARMIVDDVPWIFESHPLSYRLIHGWIENYREHDFGFSRWKYLSVDPSKRRDAQSHFTPLPLNAFSK